MKLRSLLLILLFLPTILWAQKKTTEDPFAIFFEVDGKTIQEKIFIYEVKLLDEFIGRFNLTRTINGQKVPNIEELRQASEKDANLKALYNTARTKMLEMLVSPTLKITQQQRDAFVMQLVSKHIYIGLADGKWTAVIDGAVNYQGKDEVVTLYMQMTGNQKDGYKWIITKVDAPFIAKTFANRSDNPFISPVSHEINYSDIKALFDNKENGDKLFSADQDVVTPAFRYLIGTGQLTWSKTTHIKYTFNHLPTIPFVVSFVNNPDGVSGWLITDIYLPK